MAEKVREVFDEVENFVARKEVDARRGNFTPPLRRQQHDRRRELAEPEHRTLAADGRGFYPSYAPRVEEIGEAYQQAAVVAADVEDALDRPPDFRLNVPEQTRPEDLIRALQRGVIFERR
jgi:hypothetical protein